MTGKPANQCVVAHDVVVQERCHRVQSDQNIAQCRPDLGSPLGEAALAADLAEPRRRLLQSPSLWLHV